MYTEINDTREKKPTWRRVIGVVAITIFACTSLVGVRTYITDREGSVPLRTNFGIRRHDASVNEMKDIRGASGSTGATSMANRKQMIQSTMRLSGGAGGMPGMAGMPGMGQQGAPPPPLSEQIARLHPVFLSLLTTLSWNMVGFLITANSKTYAITDLVGTSAFTLSALATMHSALTTQWGMVRRNWEKPTRPAILALATGLWATRLGGYLTYRMSGLKIDKRISKHFRKPGEIWLCGDSCYPFNLMGYWIRQALWGWMCMLPVSMASDLSQYKKLKTNGIAKALAPATLALGTMGYALGMGIECLADYQKYKFKTDKSNCKRWRWCDKGPKCKGTKHVK
uniref:Steroid 5-alpha reductase C-terminal domain-containing protein n=1 Tax=Lotharella globosa TaxID=91324 RepID=A0A7S3YDH2_9EUKA